MTKTSPIRTDQDARAWLTENDPSALAKIQTRKDGSEVVVESAACGRCGGSGFGGWFQDGGRCYECGGVDTSNATQTIELKPFAQAQKAKATRQVKAAEKRVDAAERSLEGQREWNEKNGNGRLTFAERDEQRAAERKEARALTVHVGTPKKRETFELTLAFKKGFDGAYGMRWMHRFEDPEGNALVWWTAEPLTIDGDFAEHGDKILAKATVKEHGEYQGQAQTIVTRLKVTEILALKITEPRSWKAPVA